MPSSRFLLLILAALSQALVRLTPAVAAPVVFQVDPALSSVTLSGKIAGTTIQEQGPGSLTSRFGGVIRADLTPTSILFTGGSSIDALTNGVWEPNVGGGSGSAPADFGGKATSLFAVVKGAFRDVIMDVASPILPLTAGAFDSGALAFGFPENSNASLDYDLILVKGGVPLSGLATNQIGNAGTIITQGETHTLTIKIDTEYKFKALTTGDSTVRFVGQIVAVSASQPVIGPITIGADNKLTFVVDGATATTRLQSCADLRTWLDRVADRVADGSTVRFTVEPSGAIEFFRVAQ